MRRWGNIVGETALFSRLFRSSRLSYEYGRMVDILQEYVCVPDGDLYSKVSKRSFCGPYQSQHKLLLLGAGGVVREHSIEMLST